MTDEQYIADITSMADSYAELQQKYFKRLEIIKTQAARIAELEALVVWQPVKDGEYKCGCANDTCTRIVNVADDGRDIALCAYRDSGMSIMLGDLRICRPVDTSGATPATERVGEKEKTNDGRTT